MYEEPESHVAMRREKAPGADCGVWCCWWRNVNCDGERVDSGDFETGEKVKRKFGSPLRC